MAARTKTPTTPAIDPTAHYWVRMKMPAGGKEWQVAEQASAIDAAGLGLDVTEWSIDAFVHYVEPLGWRVSEDYTGYNLVGGMAFDDADGAIAEARARLTATGPDAFAQIMGRVMTEDGISPRFSGIAPEEK